MQTLLESLVFDAGASPTVTVMVVIGIIIVIANIVRGINNYFKSHSEKRRLITWEKEHQEVIRVYKKYVRRVAAWLKKLLIEDGFSDHLFF